MSIKNIPTPMKLGQDLISLGLKVQKREIPMDYVLNKINLFALQEINNSTDWQEGITSQDMISALMEIQSITQSDLAKRLNVSRQFVSDVLNGKKKLTNTVAKRIAAALGVNLSAITPK